MVLTVDPPTLDGGSHLVTGQSMQSTLPLGCSITIYTIQQETALTQLTFNPKHFTTSYTSKQNDRKVRCFLRSRQGESPSIRPPLPV